MLDILQLNEQLVQEGLVNRKDLYQLNERQARCFMMTQGGYTIAPDGKLYNCSHVMSENQCVGSVWQYNPDHPARQEFLNGHISTECRQCKAFSICKGGCRIGELDLANMPQCHPYKNILSSI